MSEPSVHESIETLPVELVSCIAAYLDLDSVRSLRRVSKAVATSSFDAFRIYLRSKRITLSLESIRRIIKDLESNGPARHMEEIILMGESATEYPRLLKLLGTSFVLAKTKGKLHSMDIESPRDGLVLILLALQASGIPLRRLRINPNGGRLTTPMDSYQMDNLHTLGPCLQLVKEFSWSLTSRPNRSEGRIGTAVTTGIQNVDAINQILSMAQATEKLDLLWYKTAPLREPEAYFFETCYDSVLAMTRLEECTLRGLYVTELTLRKFLQRTTATTITLKAIHLRPGGEFQSVLDVITSGKFHKFTLEDLYQYKITHVDEQYVMIFFNVLGRSKFGPGHHAGPSTITREGKDVHMHLEYTSERMINERTPQAQAYLRLSLATYGSD